VKKIFKVILGLSLLILTIWIFHPDYPNQWDSITLNDSRMKMENQIGKSLTADFWDVKGDVYIYETFLGWYRLDIHSGTNEKIGMINIKFYLGTKDHYKTWNLKNVVQHRI
jgi:hypothetical protein|tara:strand:+ start:1629 stop:1961 length:333 start_codon:yes stop_codon:yes gene_type:complete